MLAEFVQGRETSEVFQVDIHPACSTIGKGIMVDHATGVVVGETASAGKMMFHSYMGVTLGGTGKEAGDRHRDWFRHDDWRGGLYTCEILLLANRAGLVLAVWF